MPTATNPADLAAELANRFAYHPATETTGLVHDKIRAHCRALALDLAGLMPPGRHAALALTALEEAMHWANAAVACDTHTRGG